jgi:hypothetical protein
MSTTTSDNHKTPPTTTYKPSPVGIPELQNATFTYGVQGQADRFVKAQRLIADYVGRTMGKDLFLLLTEREEASFPEPHPPTGRATTVEVERYKILLQHSVTQLQDYTDKKAKLLRLLLIQCQPSLRSKIELLPEFKKLQKDDDVLGLLDKIKELVYSTEGSQYQFWTLQATVSNLINVHQAPTEPPQTYFRRFMEHVAATEAIWGSLYPTKLAKPLNTDGSDDALKDAQQQGRNRLLACVFLAGTDRNRYKQVIDDLNNDHILGHSNYPEDPQAMLTYILNRRGPGTTTRIHDDLQDGVTRLSFAQGDRFNQQKRIRCPKCKRFGHSIDACPDNDDDSVKSNKSDSSTRTYTLQEVKALLENQSNSTKRTKKVVSVFDGAQFAFSGDEADPWNGYMTQK